MSCCCGEVWLFYNWSAQTGSTRNAVATSDARQQLAPRAHARRMRPADWNTGHPSLWRRQRGFRASPKSGQRLGWGCQARTQGARGRSTSHIMWDLGAGLICVAGCVDGWRLGVAGWACKRACLVKLDASRAQVPATLTGPAPTPGRETLQARHRCNTVGRRRPRTTRAGRSKARASPLARGNDRARLHASACWVWPSRVA